MTPADLLPIIRRDYLDEDLAVIGDPELSVRWPREFILREIGQAQRQACLRQDLKHIFDDETAEVCEIAVVAGAPAYDLDPRVLRIESAMLDSSTTGIALWHSSRAWMDERCPQWRTHEARQPSRFLIEGRRLTLWPTPVANDTLRLAVWRLPLVEVPNWSTPLEWPGEQEKLAHWVAYRAFLRPNPDTVQVELAKTHLALFEQAFGAAVADRVRGELLMYPDSLSLKPGGRPMGAHLEGW